MRILYILSLITVSVFLSSCAISVTSGATSEAISETFNATSGTTSTGGDIVTSATSSSDSQKPKDNAYVNKLTAYITANGDAVKQNIAAGSGEHLDAIAAILDIKNPEPFYKRLQENFDTIFTAGFMSSDIVAKRIFKYK